MSFSDHVGGENLLLWFFWILQVQILILPDASLISHIICQNAIYKFCHILQHLFCSPHLFSPL